MDALTAFLIVIAAGWCLAIAIGALAALARRAERRPEWRR